MHPSNQASPGTSTSPQETTISVTIHTETAQRLRTLISPDDGLPDLSAVVGRLIDHVQQGVYRPGAWERDWLCQALGDAWLERVEPDPETPCFDRPRAEVDRPVPSGLTGLADRELDETEREA